MTSTVGHEAAALTSQLAEMCGMAAQAMEHATHALLLADREVADAVITGHQDSAAMGASAEETTFLLLARQPPLANDLRAIVNAVRIAVDAERMAGLAVHVAEIARRHHPHHAVPAEVSGRVAELSASAVALARAAQEELLSPEPRPATRLRRGDRAVNDLYRQLLTIVVEPGWAYSVTAAVDVALISRLYERFADHAARIAECLSFPCNGHELPSGSLDITSATRPRTLRSPRPAVTP